MRGAVYELSEHHDRRTRRPAGSQELRAAAAGRAAVALAFVGRDLLTADALRWMFGEHRDFRVFGAFRTARDLEVALAGVRLDAVVYDAGAAAGAAEVEAGELRRMADDIVLLCDGLTPDLVSIAVAVCAQGVLLKSEGSAALIASMRHIALGGHAIFPAGWQELAARESLARARLAALSARQREVLALLAAGRRNEEIAAELMLSMNTVKFHVRGILAALEVRNRVEAARVWSQLGD